MTLTCRLQAFDTWFFRESRPHSSVGAPFLSSSFPPPARTVAGALRFLLGESVGVDWRVFAEQGAKKQPVHAGGHDVTRLIGFGDDLGDLDFRGPWLARRRAGFTERLYPAPRLLLTDGESHSAVSRFKVGSAVETDLGKIHLPALNKDSHVRLPVDDFWLTEKTLEEVLIGKVPHANDVISIRRLMDEEARLGIARDVGRATARLGLLYQTRHVRPRPDLVVETDLDGVPLKPDALPRMVRLGGEGRPTGVEWLPDASTFPQAPAPTHETQGLILNLLTSADLGGRWLPFEPSEPHTLSNGAKAWRGRLDGMPLEVVTAVFKGAEREGGWDLARRRPREMRGLMPAGSLWYCRCPKGPEPDSGYLTGRELTELVRKFHGRRIGTDTALGRGHLAVGLWNQDEFPEDLQISRTEKETP